MLAPDALVEAWAPGPYSAVTCRCNHLSADLAGGSIDENARMARAYAELCDARHFRLTTFPHR